MSQSPAIQKIIKQSPSLSRQAPEGYEMFTTSRRSGYVMIAVGIIGALLSLAASNFLATSASIILAVTGAFAMDLE